MLSRGLWGRRSSEEKARSTRKLERHSEPESETVATDPLLQVATDQLENISSQSAGSAPLADFKSVAFKIKGLQGEKHAVFVPDHMQLCPAQLEQICHEVGKEMPSMTVCSVGDMCHPAAIATPELCRCRDFQSIMGEARRHITGGKSGGGGILQRCFQGQQEKPLPADLQNMEQAFVNSAMENKVLATVKGIAEAASQSNAWIFTGPRPTGFEAALQWQSELTGKKDLFSVAAVHLQDRAYMENHTSRRLLKQLFEGAVPPGQAAEPITLSGDLFDSRSNLANADLRKHGISYWSFRSLDSQEASGHPLTMFPWPHAHLFLFFYRADFSGSVDWSFSTDSRLSISDVPMKPEDLAPPSYVLWGGGTLVKKQALQVLQGGRPLVIVDNTPGIAKQLSVLLGVVKSALDCDGVACDRLLADGCGARLSRNPSASDLVQGLSPAKVLKHVEASFSSLGMESLARLTLSDVVAVLDQARQMPGLFREPVCIVDPLKEQQSIATDVAAAFSSIFVDLSGWCGAMGQATRGLVLKGWQLHARLVRSRARLGWLAVSTEVFAAVVLSASAALTTFAIYLELQRMVLKEEMFIGYLEHVAHSACPNDICQRSLPTFAIRCGMIGCPVAASVVMTLQSHFQFSQKWGHVNLASHQVVAEIYQFLAGAGPYSAEPSLDRQHFLRRLQDIVKDLSLAHSEDGHTLSGNNMEDARLHSDQRALQGHINSSLYGRWMLPGGRLSHLLRGRCAGDKLPGDRASFDLTAPLTAKQYVEQRLQPLIAYQQSWCRPVRWLQGALSAIAFLLLVVAGIFAAYGELFYVPVLVPAASALLGLAGWLAASRTAAAASRGLAALQALELGWNESGIHGGPGSVAFRRRLVKRVERINLLVVSTLSQSPLLPETEEDAAPSAAEWGSPGGRRRSNSGIMQTPRSMSKSGHATPLRGSTPRRGHTGYSTPRRKPAAVPGSGVSTPRNSRCRTIAVPPNAWM